MSDTAKSRLQDEVMLVDDDDTEDTQATNIFSSCLPRKE